MTILLCSARCSFVFYVEDLHSKREERHLRSKLLSIWSWMEALNWPEKRKDKTRTKSRICREFSSVDELMSHGRKSKPFRLPEKGFELGIYIIWLTEAGLPANLSKSSFEVWGLQKTSMTRHSRPRVLQLLRYQMMENQVVKKVYFYYIRTLWKVILITTLFALLVNPKQLFCNGQSCDVFR